MIRNPVIALPSRRGFTPGSAWRLSIGIAIVIAALGCQSPRGEARRAVQRGEWDQFLAKFAEMEEDRPERLEALRLLHEEYEAQRCANLEKTLSGIEKTRRKKDREWVEAQPLQRKELEAMMRGRPDEIAKVWDLLAK